MLVLDWIATLRAPQALATVLTATLGICVAVGWRRRAALPTHKRGVIVIDARRPSLLSRWLRSPRDLFLAGVPVAAADETRHFKMIGATGTGKSTAIRQLLALALRRGDRAVFADPDGGYLGKFFDPYRGDIVLNPFERDSVRWDPFAEVSDAYDIDQLATGLIPACEHAPADEWRTYARTFLSAMVRFCRRQRNPSVQELWRLLAVAPIEELRAAALNTPAQPFLDADNSRMFGSIRAVAVSVLAALDYVHAQRAAPFSVRRWVRTARSGVLYMPYKAGQIPALRAMIATWMRLAIFETLNGSEDRDQRLWFVVDELDALGAIDGLKDALARMRKFGGRCVLGFQSLAQVSGTYGPAAAQTIVENCGNTLILRCSSSENGGTAQFASRLIGEREVMRRQTTRGSDRSPGWSAAVRRSRNVSEQPVTETAVMTSQIEQLPDLCGFLKLASSRVWRQVELVHE